MSVTLCWVNFYFLRKMFVQYDVDKAIIVLTSRFTDSMTSMKTSFFLYLMPSDRHDTALVTVAGGRGAPTSNLWPRWVMYLKETKAERKMWTCVRLFPNSICNPAATWKPTRASSSLRCFRERQNFQFLRSISTNSCSVK